jgi:hypothetical protein
MASTWSTFSMVKNGKVSTPSIQRLAGQLVRVLDLHQVDEADLAHGLADIGVVQFDLVDALELGEIVEAVGTALLPSAQALSAWCLRRCRAR